MARFRRCLFGIGTLLASRPASAVSMLYDGILPESLPAACATALMADVACDRLVRDLRPDFLYPPATLERICTSGCEAALSSWETSVRSACGLEVTIPGDSDLPVSPIMVPSTAKHTFKFTCLKENNVFCGPVAALVGVFNGPGVTIYNYLSEVPSGAVKPSNCDPCLAARLRMRSGSPYFDDPVVASESLYQKLTSSCGISGKPATTSTINYISSQPTPTPTTCSGSVYAIQSGDDCYSISKAKSVGTAWMLADNNLAAYCTNFPKTGNLCITNTCKTATVGTNGTCSAIARAANITETQLIAWNPIINPVCSNINMMNGTTLCIEPPGPKVPVPSPTDIQPSVPTTPAPIPANAAAGSNKPCGRWYLVEKGDFCNSVMLKYTISLEDFMFLNTGINVNCTNLFAEESYCVQPVGDINNYPGRPGHVSFDPSMSFTGVPFTMLPDATMSPYPRPPAQSPLATGVRDDCVHYFKGDAYQYSSADLGSFKSNCELAATVYNADHENFAAWNKLGKNVTDSACVFQKGVRYCGSWGLIPTGTTTSSTPDPTETDDGKPKPPAATHSGQPADCNKWHVVSSGDTCTSVATAAGISVATFHAWNPAVSSDCTGNFWLGQAYCIGTAGSASSTTKSATSAASPTAPGPTHTGQPANCNKWDVVASGDTCTSLASDNKISLSQFLAWNPAVSSDCTSNFWLGQAYCVGVSSGGTTTQKPTTTTTQQSTKPTAPGPTHTGQPANCNKWDVVQSGDSCGSIASDNKISVDQFYAWNPAVSKDCLTNFWLGQAYCVGVSGGGAAATSPTKTSTTTTRQSTTTKPTAPGPTHTGQPANCNKWDVVQSGDSCGSVASDNGISVNQFYAWNPAVSKDCVSNFWVGQAYCVGVSG